MDISDRRVLAKERLLEARKELEELKASGAEDEDVFEMERKVKRLDKAYVKLWL